MNLYNILGSYSMHPFSVSDLGVFDIDFVGGTSLAALTKGPFDKLKMKF